MAQPAHKRSASPSAARSRKPAVDPKKKRTTAISAKRDAHCGCDPDPEGSRDDRRDSDRSWTRLRRRHPIEGCGHEYRFEKEKHSITLDKPIVEQIRELFGERPLSASINDLLQSALVQHRLGVLVDQMEEEAGPPSAEAFDRVFSQWFEEG